ncbi:hypothetical protein HYH02_010990 [Chlamydomonas schloesseri]|uniref:Uncharacterized protein n=1 Tax=Chlamydomonas schloesseri TaxID=2026947 RepID=A0A835T3J2_9CHLO|nr:hypothetical protein HYH02_010990 [Chlamydomonas schloesseri]|eukprot:KAG2438292.1 hypothetical protein HYH02_010990 [Chlamydomonas schloesseri]
MSTPASPARGSAPRGDVETKNDDADAVIGPPTPAAVAGSKRKACDAAPGTAEMPPPGPAVSDGSPVPELDAPRKRAHITGLKGEASAFADGPESPPPKQPEQEQRTQDAFPAGAEAAEEQMGPASGVLPPPPLPPPQAAAAMAPDSPPQDAAVAVAAVVAVGSQVPTSLGPALADAGAAAPPGPCASSAGAAVHEKPATAPAAAAAAATDQPWLPPPASLPPEQEQPQQPLQAEKGDEAPQQLRAEHGEEHNVHGEHVLQRAVVQEGEAEAAAAGVQQQQQQPAAAAGPQQAEGGPLPAAEGPRHQRPAEAHQPAPQLVKGTEAAEAEAGEAQQLEAKAQAKEVAAAAAAAAAAAEAAAGAQAGAQEAAAAEAQEAAAQAEEAAAQAAAVPVMEFGMFLGRPLPHVPAFYLCWLCHTGVLDQYPRMRDQLLALGLIRPAPPGAVTPVSHHPYVSGYQPVWRVAPPTAEDEAAAAAARMEFGWFAGELVSEVPPWYIYWTCHIAHDFWDLGCKYKRDVLRHLEVLGRVEWTAAGQVVPKAGWERQWYAARPREPRCFEDAWRASGRGGHGWQCYT